jgi:alpha-beta hydrolase superfamily lysophospholipase
MNRKLRILAASMALLVVLVTMGLFGFSWFVAGKLVQSPVEQRPDDCADPRFCEATQPFDGTGISGLYFPSSNGAAVIVQHGYRGHRGIVLKLVDVLVDRGFGVAAFDLRGHGRSGGDWITLGRDDVRDLKQVVDYVEARPDVHGDRIGMIGFSMGAALTLSLAAEDPRIRAAVADSPYDVIDSVTVKTFTDLPWPFPPLVAKFMEIQLDVDFEAISPLAHVHRIHPRPIYILAAGADTVVDPGSALRLYEASDQPKTLWREPDLEHCEFFLERREQYERRIIAGFLSEHLLGE